jgi:hypothetical protein
MNPRTKEFLVVVLHDRPKLLRLFKADQGDEELFWHCIVVDRARRTRWSFGFVIPGHWMSRL